MYTPFCGRSRRWTARACPSLLHVLLRVLNLSSGYGHHTWCRGARPVLPWACLPGRRLGPLHMVLHRIWPYQRKILRNGSGKIFCEAHNFVSSWNFDERLVAFKAWDAGDADRGIARVNRATRARAIGTCLRSHFGSVYL